MGKRCEVRGVSCEVRGVSGELRVVSGEVRVGLAGVARTPSSAGPVCTPKRLPTDSGSCDRLRPNYTRPSDALP